MPQAAKQGNRNAGKKSKRFGVAPWDDPSWPSDRAERAIKFIETYCILPDGYGSGQTLVLAEFQKQWLREVLQPGLKAAVMQIPRGNGKSTFLAAVALWALFDPFKADGRPKIPIVATTVRQINDTMYGTCLFMREQCPEMEERSHSYAAMGNQKIVNLENKGELFPVAKDADGLQGLNPTLAVCDEIGFMPIESWTSLLQSIKRSMSLIVGIGTPGFDQHNALWALRKQVKAGGPIKGFHYTEFAADENCDLYDQDQWRKANPALVEGYKPLDSVEIALAVAPESHFRIFQLGQWVDGVESWLGSDGRALWRSLAEPWAMEPSGDTWVGVDVGLKHDSTAVTWLQRREDGRFHAKTKIWLPTPDGRLDVSDAMQFLRELGAQYNLKAVAYDPRFFDLPAQQLADEGYPVVEFNQSLERMTPACGMTYEMVKRSEITHDGDEQFETQVLNAVIRSNERGFTLAKAKSKDRIDACVAMVMALRMALAPEPEKPPVALGAIYR